jgi:hypothetical protein
VRLVGSEMICLGLIACHYHKRPPSIITNYPSISSTYDHRISNLAFPVCSVVLKRDTGGLVVKWVTIGESSLLYVFAFVAFRSKIGARIRWEHG